MPPPLTAWPLLAYLVAMPWALLALPENVHDSARMAQVLVMATMAWSLVRNDRSAAAPSLPPLVWLALTGAAASVAASSVPAEALKEAVLLGGLVWLGLAGGRAAHADRDRWLAALAIGSAIYAGLLVSRMALAMAVGLPLDARDIVPGYVNYRFLSHTQTVAMPLLALAVVLSRWPVVRGLAAFALVVHAMFLLVLGARATGLGLLCGMAFVAVLRPTGARPLLTTLGTAMLAGGLMYLLLFQMLPGWVGTAADATTQRSAASLSSDGSRGMLWQLAWDQALAAPWLGQGPMHYAHTPNPKAAHPHNIYLQIAAEWGFPLLILALGVVAKLLWRLGRRLSQEQDPLCSAEGSAVALCACAVLVDGFFSGNFVMPVPQMWVALGLGWAWSWAAGEQPLRGAERAAPAPRTGWLARAVPIAALLGVAWLAGVSAVEFRTLDDRLHRARVELADNPRDNPRFWSHGWF